MLLYEIADNVHWLMLIGVKHIKKSMLCVQGSFIRSLMPPMSKQRIKFIHLVNASMNGVKIDRNMGITRMLKNY